MVIIMLKFICPVCKQQLSCNQKAYKCANGHSFDVSKDGYVNLLMSQQSSLKRHGDDKLMVRARREFLSAGYYEALKDALVNVVSEYVKAGVIIDVGCGEGYYSLGISQIDGIDFYGIDISKDALRFASKHVPSGHFAVASAFTLPFADKSADCISCVFAPSAYNEFHRVLKDGGYLIKAVPLSEHLWDLKRALYDEPYKNKPEIRDDSLFELIDFQEIKYVISVNSSEQVQNLFKMTPYYYKTGRQEAENLSQKSNLSTTVHFGVEVYKKR